MEDSGGARGTRQGGGTGALEETVRSDVVPCKHSG